MSSGFDQNTEGSGQKSIFFHGLNSEDQGTSEEHEMICYRKDKSRLEELDEETERDM